ncbi:MAG: DUF4065 domain-containing protein [Bacteroidota bacterium]|nr:DUF4065 domain-containing protein [Bacteroidota bacterium]
MANTVDILNLSKYLVLRFQNEGIPLTPLKLQKLLYYIQAWHTVFFEKHSLFNEEPEAWANGPVYRSVYDIYKNQWLRNTPIVMPVTTSDKLLEDAKTVYNGLKLEGEQKKYLEALLKKYGQLSPERLVFMTHSEAPWNDAREGLGPFDKCDQKISTESMFQYYNNRIAKKS